METCAMKLQERPVIYSGVNIQFSLTDFTTDKAQNMFNQVHSGDMEDHDSQNKAKHGCLICHHGILCYTGHSQVCQ